MRISLIALGSRGDVQPYVAIGKGLRAAGHSVRVVTHAPFEDFVRGSGLDFSPLGADPWALVASMTDRGVNSRQRLRLPRSLVAARDFMRSGRGMVEAVLQATPEMTEACWRASQDADVLVLSTFGALVGIPTARELRIPAVVAHVAPLVATVDFQLPGPLPPAPAWLRPVRPSYNLLTGGGGLSEGRVTDDVFTLEAVPHDWLFPRVAAVVHHGGAGTTGEGLRAGRPTVVVPFIADQHFWGQQVYERGVGPRPISRRHLSAEALAGAIDAAVTDRGMVARAAALGGRIRAEDGIGAAVEAVETVFARPGHVRPTGAGVGNA